MSPIKNISPGRLSHEERGSPPTGTVTFLFSDIEGSTQLLHRLGDQYVEVLETQRRLLRTAFQDAQGHEIDTAGDGFFVGFNRARDAVAAAVAAQQALAEYSWPGGVAVRVRMGLHTGEPLLSEGSYVGLDVHRAARICSAGHGGQVLLSQSTRELVEQELPPGVTLHDLGAHRLKDFSHPEHLYQLVIPGLPDDFPLLRTLTSRLDKLPAQPTGFIGREHEVETIRQLLLRDAVRLVTLTGPGGTGKTRLAIETATGLMEAFPDGVCFVPLASITDPGLVAATIAKTLEISENAASPVLDSVKDHLNDKAVLLVLDNFEQVIGASPIVAELLVACPAMKVLVTSRVVLHLNGEYEYAVPPLRLPDPEQVLPPEALLSYSAIALFIERAQAVRPGFTLTAENVLAIARLCIHVDGLPLAIELAAARIKLFSPQALLTRLGSRLDLLKGGARDAPVRHQTLRQTIAWSYDLLSTSEQAFFRRLAVFMGGCTLEAADYVCTACDDLEQGCSGCGGGELDALDAIAVLVDQSLLRQDEDSEGEPRFVMLETIREYGVESLRAAQEEAPVGRAHATYFLALAEQAEPELTGAEQSTWMDRLETEHDNLRAALSWAEAHDAEVGLRLGAALWRFWVSRGHMREGRGWLERLLALPSAQERTSTRARALNGAGTLAHETSEFKAARTFLEESLSIGRDLGDKRGVALTLNNLGWLAVVSNDFSALGILSEESMALCRELGEKRGLAVALNNLGFGALIQDEYAKAVSLLEESLSLRREIGDHRGYAYELTYLGWTEHLQGHHERAAACIEEALVILRELGDKQGCANALGFLGGVRHDLGHNGRAAELLEEGVSLWREVGNKSGIAEGLNFLGMALLDLGHLEKARTDLEEAVAIYREVGIPWGLGNALYSLGCVAVKAERYEEALDLYRESLELRQKTPSKRGMAECLEAIAKAFSAQGHLRQAAELLGAAEIFREEVHAPLPPRSQASYERDISYLRAKLGEDAFTSAWEEGRAMPVRQAVATGNTLWNDGASTQVLSSSAGNQPRL